MDSAARIPRRNLPDFREKHDHLFSSPFCWNANRFCTFLINTYKKLESANKRMRKLKRNNNQHSRQQILKDIDMGFCDSLEKEANKQDLWPPGKTWKDVLGANFFKSLADATRHLKWDVVGNLDPNSLLSLVELIRNCHQHPEVGKHKDVKWYRVVQENGGSDFDECLFAQFWITRFPKLPLFLWNALKPKSAQLKNYYKGNVDFIKKNNFHTFLEFVNGVNEACKNQMDSGYLTGRLKMITERDTHTIELRPLDTNLLGSVLNGSKAAQIVLDEKQMYFSWSDNLDSEQKLTYNFPASHQAGINTEAAQYVFTIGFGGENHCILDQWTMQAKKVVVFITPDSIENVVKMINENPRFSEYPIEWNDISCFTRQNLKISVKNSYMDKCVKYEEILSKLNGKELNSLLRNKKVDLLENYKTPEICKYYTPRRIYNREIVSSSILSADFSNDILIIIKCSGAESLKTKNKPKIVNETDVIPVLNLKDDTCRLFLIEQDILDFYTKIDKFEGCSIKYYNVHFLKCIENGKLKWLHTHGRISGLKPHLLKAAKEVGVIKEGPFVSSLKSKSEKNERLLFLADEPGMGKSEILSSFTKELESDGKIVLLLPMNMFVEHLHSKSVHRLVEAKKHVVLALSELACGNGFKSELFAEILRNDSLSSNLEIMLDGLDEVKSSLISLAFDVIKILKSELPLARVWVTCREYLLESVRQQFGRLGYVLEPFSRDEQIGFLVGLWSDSMRVKQETLDITTEIKNQMAEFAKRCIEKCLSMDYKEIAGVPLQCRMIGEIFKAQVLEKNFNLEHNSYTLCDIYDLFIKRKMEIYFNETKKFGIPMDDEIAKGFLEALLSGLTKFSLKLIYPDSSYFDTHVSEVWQNILERHGIVKETKPLVFMHRTFAEYLVARHIVEKVAHLSVNGNFQTLNEEFQKFLLTELFNYECEDIEKMKNFKLCFKESTLLKFLEMHLERKSKKGSTIGSHSEQIERNLDFLATTIASEKVDLSHYTFHGSPSDNLLPIFTIAGGLGLGNIIKLLYKFPDGPVYTLLYGIYTFCESEAIFEVIASKLHPGSEHWDKIPSLNDENQSILHYVIERMVTDRNNFGRDDIEKTCSYIKKIVDEDNSILEHKDKCGQTPLLYLADLFNFEKHSQENYWELFRLLVQLNADINAVDLDNNTVMHGRFYGECVSYTHLELVKYVVDEAGYKRENFNIFNAEGETPLLSALKQEWKFPDYEDLNDVEVYDKVIGTYENCGTDLNAIDEYGSSVLLRAIENTYVKIAAIKSLVKHGANVNAVDSEKNSALHFIFYIKRFELGVKDMTSLLEWFTVYLELVEYFLENGFRAENLNSFNDEGDTPLLAAVQWIRSCIKECSLEQAFKKNESIRLNSVTSSICETDMNRIADGEKLIPAYRNAIKVLICGTNINAKDKHGNTVLHRAIEMGCGLEFIIRLIEKGADVFALNNKGENPAKIAFTVNSSLVYNFLREKYPGNFDYGTAECKIGSEGDEKDLNPLATYFLPDLYELYARRWF